MHLTIATPRASRIAAGEFATGTPRVSGLPRSRQWVADLIALAIALVMLMLVGKGTEALFEHERWVCAQRVTLDIRAERPPGSAVYRECVLSDAEP